VFLSLTATQIRGAEPVDIGSRRELFVDLTLIDSVEGKAELKLHHPTPREIPLRFDEPWEGNASGYPTVFQDGELYRMYYRGHRYLLDKPPLRQAQTETVCYAESRDGIHWTKPKLGIHKWPGVDDNNIIWMGEFGRTDAQGAEVVDRPISVIDFMATVNRMLQVNKDRDLVTPNGRPIRIVDKDESVIEEVLR